MIITWVFGIIIGVFGILDVGLIIFHIRIKIQGVSTYQWVIAQ